jgi:hypothetical protein
LFLENSKKNSLEHFYKNIEAEKNAYPQEEDKFKDYSQFREHIASLKEQKKQRELEAAEREIENPFQTSNFTALPSQPRLAPAPLPTSYNPTEPPTSQPPQYNFSKKPAPQTQSNYILRGKSEREEESSKFPGALPKEKLEIL